jgi:hypothetical protein
MPLLKSPFVKRDLRGLGSRFISHDFINELWFHHTRNYRGRPAETLQSFERFDRRRIEAKFFYRLFWFCRWLRLLGSLLEVTGVRRAEALLFSAFRRNLICLLLVPSTPHLRVHSLLADLVLAKRVLITGSIVIYDIPCVGAFKSRMVCV